jgi:hypothetical protein
MRAGSFRLLKTESCDQRGTETDRVTGKKNARKWRSSQQTSDRLLLLLVVVTPQLTA